jgi:WXG100 family type VII secretion target
MQKEVWPMDNEVIARLDQMEEAASNIGNSASKIDGAISQADQQVSALSPDRYMSPGAEAFRASYSRLTPRLKEAATELQKFQARLAEAAQELRDAAQSRL